MATFRRTALTIALSLATLGAGAAMAQQPAAKQTAGTAGQLEPVRTGSVAANGVNYYYEIYGRGAPLLLLHGGLGSIDMFRPILPALANGRQVIAVDLQGHGRTPLGERPISPPAMGDDMATVIRQLRQDTVDIVGYSMGGAVALRLAIQHPEVVRRVVLVSTPYARNGWHAEMLPQQAAVGAAMAPAMKETPMYQSYVAVAPKPEDFPRLLDRMGEWMRTPYDWSEEVKKLKGPVMLVYGDGDMVRPEHIVSFYQLLGGGLKDAGWQRENLSKNRLAVLPNLTHYEMFISPALAHTVLPFLNGETAAPVWNSGQ